MVTVAHSSIIYDVEFEDRNFSVTFDTDENIGYTNVTVHEDGIESEDMNLCDRLEQYILKQIST